MYDPHLRLTMSGTTWQMRNPLRTSERDPAARLRAQADSYDRIATHATAAGVAAGVVVLTVLVAIGGAIIPSVLLGLLAGVSTVIVWNWWRKREFDLLEQHDRELTDTLGPQTWSLDGLGTSAIATEVDAVANSALTITGSGIFTQGYLGNPDTVAGDLRDVVWEAVQLATDADRRAQLHGATSAHIDAHTADGEVDARLLSAADQTLADDLAQLRDYAATIGVLADQVINLDARRVAPSLNDNLRAVVADTPRNTDVSALERLSAQLSAAATVLDSSNTEPRLEDGPS